MKIFYLEGNQIKEFGTDKLWYQDYDCPNRMWKEIYRDFKDEGFIIQVFPRKLRRKIEEAIS